ncbi:MAG: hypothetical protein AAGB16_10855, partial [Pseudomonadota bacterium]
VGLVLSFFWAGESGAFYQALQAQFDELARENPNNAPPADAVEGYFAVYTFIYPFVYILLHGCVGSLVFFWGSKTGWVTRLRLYFAHTAVGMTVSLITIILTPLMNADAIGTYTAVTLMLGAIIYMATYIRGMVEKIGLWKRVRRGAMLALAITATDLSVGILVSLGTTVWLSRIVF